jgi:outer membrane protein assembly factor BamB
MLIFVLVLPVLAILLSGCAEGLQAASWPGITIDGEYAYVAAGPQLYAVALEDGDDGWKFSQKGNMQNPFAIYAAPVLTPDGQLIVGAYNTVLYSLDPKVDPEQENNINWSFTDAKDRWIGSVLVANDRIYAPNADHRLYILDFDGKLQGKPFEADNAIWSTPVTDGEKVYFTSLGSTVYALDALSGEKVWEQKIDGAILGGIAISPEGVLYIGTFSGIVTALDTDGQTLWEKQLSGQIWSTPALSNGALYVGTSDNHLYALSTADGSEISDFEADAPVLGTPLILEDKIIFGTELGTLYFLDRETLEDDREILVGKLYGTPILAGERILVAPVNGDYTLIAFDLEGKQDWTFTPDK